jgi:hypothetical protein
MLPWRLEIITDVSDKRITFILKVKQPKSICNPEDESSILLQTLELFTSRQVVTSNNTLIVNYHIN